MMTQGGIEARILWQLLFSGVDGTLEEPASDYGGSLDRMEAAALLDLMTRVQVRLKELGVDLQTIAPSAVPVRLFIDKQYTIHLGSPEGTVLPLRPLVKTLFILFLRHPEGILLKQRDLYGREMEDIYAAITPNTSTEDVKARIGRLVNLQDNSFSEKASVLNARLDELLPRGSSDAYKIQGYNGHPRRIPLNPLLVTWL